MNRFPLNGTFELTARCNLRCKMCLVRVDEPRIRELGTRELTAAEWIDLARQAADMGTVTLLLTGGEPMFRKDFCEIYEAIAKMGFYLTLYTNGTLITPEVRDMLEKFPPHKIGVTLYGASENTYEVTCGHRSGYRKSLSGVEFLRSLPSQLELRTTPVKSNLMDLDSLRAYSESLGVKFIISNLVSRQIRGGIADAALVRLSPEEQLKLYLNATMYEVMRNNDPNHNDYTEQKLKNEYHEMKHAQNRREHEDKLRQSRGERTSLLGCGAGMDQFCLTWDGRLIGCQMLDSCGINVLDFGLKEAWESYPSTIPSLSSNPICINCTHIVNCQACPATRLAESGCYNGIPEYNCCMAHIASRMDYAALIEKYIKKNEKNRIDWRDDICEKV